MDDAIPQILVVAETSRSQRRGLRAFPLAVAHCRAAHPLPALPRPRARRRAQDHRRARRVLLVGGRGRFLCRESQARSSPTRALLWIAGIAVIALLFYFFWEIWLSPLSPFRRLAHPRRSGGPSRPPRNRNATFWLFNHRLWLGAALALVGAGLFGCRPRRHRRDVEPPVRPRAALRTGKSIWYASALGFVAPVSFLAFAPRSFTDPITAREETDFTMRAVAALVKFVLVPLLLVYTAILYAYAVKIALAWELPKGTLGSLVVGYLLVGAATLLLGYPSRESGGALRPPVLALLGGLAALPVVLLFIAVGRRIADYGVTEQRYLMVLVGVWALILAAASHRARPRFRSCASCPACSHSCSLPRRSVPGGVDRPLGAEPEGSSSPSILDREGHAGRRQDRAAPAKVRRRTRSAAMRRARAASNGISTLTTRSICSRPGSRARPNDPFAPARRPRRRRASCFVALGLRADVANSSGVVYFTHYSDVPAVLALAKDRPCHRPGRVPSRAVRSRRRSRRRRSPVEGLGAVHLELADNATHRPPRERRRRSSSTSQDAAKEIYRRGWPLTQDHHPVEIKGTGTDLSARS